MLSLIRNTPSSSTLRRQALQATSMALAEVVETHARILQETIREVQGVLPYAEVMTRYLNQAEVTETTVSAIRNRVLIEMGEEGMASLTEGAPAPSATFRTLLNGQYLSAQQKRQETREDATFRVRLAAARGNEAVLDRQARAAARFVLEHPGVEGLRADRVLELYLEHAQVEDQFRKPLRARALASLGTLLQEREAREQNAPSRSPAERESARPAEPRPERPRVNRPGRRGR